MSASVTAMPNTRTLHIPAFDAMTRKVLLAGMAINLIEDPARLGAADVAVLLAAYAAESHTPEGREEAWHRYVDAVRDSLDAENGRLTWADLDVLPGTRTEPATEITRQNAAACLALLVYGGTQGGPSHD
jgi:hypothetical protein